MIMSLIDSSKYKAQEANFKFWNELFDIISLAYPETNILTIINATLYYFVKLRMFYGNP